MIKNFIVLVIALMASTSLHGQWKIDKISLGFENGIKKDFNTITQNDGGYFLQAQYKWFGRRFLLGNYYYGGNINVYFKNKFVIDFGIHNHTVAFYDIVYVPSLKRGSSGSGESPYLRYSLGVGREIKVRNRLYYQPSLQLSYIPTDYDLGEGNGGGGGGDDGINFKYRTQESIYSNQNFLLGLKNTFQWKFNDRLNLNFGFSYNHGLQKFSKTDHTLYLTSAPETIYKGETISRLSHSTLFLSAQYSIWHADKKAQ